MVAAIAASCAIPLSKWLVFICPSLAGFECPLTVYDFEDHLINRNSGQVIITYDGDGNRVSKTVGGVTTLFLVDDRNPSGYAQVLEELTVTGASAPVPDRLYTYGTDLISQNQWTGSAWTLDFYGYDGHGNVRYLTDTNAAVTDTYDYDAFGTLIAQSGTTPNNYLYCGEQFDADFGLYYNRARYLNADSGRFWTMDKFEGLLKQALTLHKYMFGNGDGVNRVDPSGYETLAEVGETEDIEFDVERDVIKRSTGERKRVIKTLACKAGVAFAEGSLEALFYDSELEGHHSINQSFGGAANQQLLMIPPETHAAFHQVLNLLLRSDEQFGGMGNWTSAEDWTEFTDTRAGREAMLDVILEAAGIVDEKCKLTPPNNLTTFANRLGQEWVNSAQR